MNVPIGSLYWLPWGPMSMDAKGILNVNGVKYDTGIESVPAFDIVKSGMYFVGHQFNPNNYSSIQLLQGGYAAFGAGIYYNINYQGVASFGGFYGCVNFGISGADILPWDTMMIKPKRLTSF